MQTDNCTAFLDGNLWFIAPDGSRIHTQLFRESFRSSRSLDHAVKKYIWMRIQFINRQTSLRAKIMDDNTQWHIV